jgi:predicted deacylase
MIKFSQILREQISDSSLLNQIASIFETVLQKYSLIYETKRILAGDWCEIRFLKKNYEYGPDGGAGSISFKVDGDNNLHLVNAYVPNDIKGKGYLTEVLTQIRQLNGISGKCRIHVAVNREGWKTILRRAGFEFIVPETDKILLGKTLKESYLSLFKLRDDYEQVILGEVEGNPIVLLKPKKMRKSKRVLITSVAHGDETSGLSAILNLINDGFEDNDVDVSFIPLLNPTGFIKGTREDEEEKNPNRGYIRDLDPISSEGEIIKKNIRILNALARDAFLDMHEDPREKNFYMYEYAKEQSVVAKEILKIGKKHFKKLFDGGILNSEEDNEDGSLEDYMHENGSKISIVTEIPGKWPIEKRIEASIEIIKKFVELI